MGAPGYACPDALKLRPTGLGAGSTRTDRTTPSTAANGELAAFTRPTSPLHLSTARLRELRHVGSGANLVLRIDGACPRGLERQAGRLNAKPQSWLHGAGRLAAVRGTRFAFFGMEPVPPRCVVCKEVPISEVPISNIN